MSGHHPSHTGEGAASGGLDMLQIEAIFEFARPLPGYEEFLNCEQQAVEIFGNKWPVEQEVANLELFRRALMTLLREAIQLSRSPDGQQQAAVSLTLKAWPNLSEPTWKYTLRLLQESDKPTDWVFRPDSKDGGEPHRFVFSHCEQALEVLKTFLWDKTDEWLSQIRFSTGPVEEAILAQKRESLLTGPEPEPIKDEPLSRVPAIKYPWGRPESTFLGRELREIEIRSAMGSPWDIFDLPHWVKARCRLFGFKTLLDLLIASRLQLRRNMREQPFEFTRCVLRIDDYLRGARIAERIERGVVRELAGNVRQLIRAFDPIYAEVLEQTACPGAGRYVTRRMVGRKGGILNAGDRYRRDRAFDFILRELDGAGARFQCVLRSLCAQLLTAKQGLASVREWRDPNSELYRNQDTECRAFIFLCRACKTEPAALSPLIEDGLCFDLPETAERFKRAIKRVKKILRGAAGWFHFEEMRQRLGPDNDDPEGAFLWRCVTLSKEVSIGADRIIRSQQKSVTRPAATERKPGSLRRSTPLASVTAANESRSRP